MTERGVVISLTDYRRARAASTSPAAASAVIGPRGLTFNPATLVRPMGLLWFFASVVGFGAVLHLLGS